MYDVSVIIPNYNRTVLLNRAVNSVLSQTFKPYEIIVVDDGSNETTREYIQNEFHHSLIKILYNESCLGAAKARNIGAKVANGNFISFLDSDDYWDNVKLKSQIDIIFSNPRIDIVYSDQWIVNEKTGKRLAFSSFSTLHKNNLWNKFLDGWIAPNTSTILIRKDSFDQIGGFDSSLESCQDHDLWMRISQSDMSIMYSSKKLVYFSQDAESRISFDYLKRINGARKFLNKWKRSIVNSRGLLFYMKFRRNYLFIVAKPIFDYYYKENKLLAIKVLNNVLLRNGLYYKFLVKQGISAIKGTIKTLKIF